MPKTFSGRTATVLADLAACWPAGVKQPKAWPCRPVSNRIVEDTHYREYIEMRVKKARIAGQLEELRRLAYEYQERGLTAFLENLAPGLDQDTIPERSDSPTLLTLHAAKGLEFSVVFIIGLDEACCRTVAPAMTPRNGRGAAPVLRWPDARQEQPLPGARRTRSTFGSSRTVKAHASSMIFPPL